MPDPTFSYREPIYLDVGTEDTPDIQLFKYATQLDESPSAKTSDRAYVFDKSTTVLNTGFQTSFPFAIDEYVDNPVCEFIRAIGEEQKLGTMCPLYVVRLNKPATEPNTFYARKFIVGPAVASITRVAGEIKSISGNLNTIGDVVIGTFNTTTKAFTENAAVQGLMAPMSLKAKTETTK